LRAGSYASGLETKAPLNITIPAIAIAGAKKDLF
jgi:hypothetical protein